MAFTAPSIREPGAPSGLRPAQPLRTLRFALVVAALFMLLTFSLTAGDPAWRTLAGWANTAWSCLVYSLTISMLIELLFYVVRRIAGSWLTSGPDWRRTVYHWVTPMVGVVLGMTIAALLLNPKEVDYVGPALRMTPLGALAFVALMMAMFYGFFAIRVRQQRAERQAVEAQLKLLQGQIEPHFLFNTLANVVSLMDVDTPRAKLMLESFVDYLRSSLGGLRREQHTLGDEVELVDAYLRVIAIRMDDRLRYTIDVPEALRGIAMPALTLQPLVENAVVHGLEPKIDGGTIRIEARVADGAGTKLEVSVIDDGLGLSAPSGGSGAGAQVGTGTGTAIANIRERLAQAHGDEAGLRIDANAPHGVRATLSLPAHRLQPTPNLTQ